MSAALTADDAADAPERTRAFRVLADTAGGDRLALAAQIRSVHRDALPLDRITVPTLVLTGAEDPLATRPEVLASAIAGAELTVLPGDHLTAVRDPGFAGAVAEFLARV